MTDLHAREAELPDFDGPVVELIEEGRSVGVAYLEDGAMLVEFHTDEDGAAWAFDVADLQRVLDTAAAMLGVDEPVAAAPPGGGHPVDRLAEEFDAAADFRGEEDEGFYPVPAAAAIVARCESLGLAVVALEGFIRLDRGLEPVAGHQVDLADAHAGEPWLTFQAGCNVQARALLERWSMRSGLIVAMEVADDSGERFVL
ncbi:MAG: hypothetical protein HZA58_09285 [Acidimicrobiia bacterium]|nr:hypothetical protein [Acidimicrobiia bacterium]